jgi:zinc protease
MKNIRFIILLFTAIILIAPLNMAQSGNPAIDSDGYGRSKLKNGLDVLINYDSSTSLTAANIIINGGLISEKESNNGISNLMIKMLLKGNDEMSADQIGDRLEFLGAQVSADAYRDFTSISITCLSENFPEVLSIITRSLLYPSFPQSELDKLKIEIGGTLKSESDNQVTASQKLFRGTIYGNYVYGLPLLGTPETIENITIPQIKDHYQWLASAPNMLFSIASDIKPSNLAALLEKELGNLSDGQISIDVPIINLRTEKEGFISFNRNQSFIHLGYPLPHLDAKEIPEIIILNEIMGANVGSRLWYLRQKEKLAYNVYSQYSLNKYDALFLGAIGTDTSKTNIAIASLRREMKRLVDEGITESELADAKISMKNNLIYKIERKSNRAYNMAYFETIGYGYKFVKELFVEADKVTVDKTNQIVKIYLLEEKQYLAIVGKK